MPKPIDLFADTPDEPAPKRPRLQIVESASHPTANPPGEAGYTAADIEVLEGLEPVRRRPGMYIGGTDAKALHHLFAEVIDNSMDEVLAGHATFIEVRLESDGFLTVTDNGRGIPVDKHPKFQDRSALEVIMTMLHSGGKFDSKVYETSGGLHGVGVSVVNALSERLEVEVARNQILYRQTFSRGIPLTALERVGPVQNRRGTRIRFRPDAQIFTAQSTFDPARLFSMARAKAYLFAGVEIRWSCAPELVSGTDIPERTMFRFPSGLRDFLAGSVQDRGLVIDEPFAGQIGRPGTNGAVEWAITWADDGDDGSIRSYCNTVHTAEGGTHELGLRTALARGLKAHAERIGHKRSAAVTADDAVSGCIALLSVFVREPEFQGQTKDRLASPEAARLVETAMRDAFDHWLVASPGQALRLLDFAATRAEERLRRKQERDVLRKTATRKLRLPGKLADCAQAGTAGAELFIVEGDSAGGSAKQARDRSNQAVLPLRGKILNVANAGEGKLAQNQQLADLLLALGCQTRSRYRESELRYERVIVMTDADVDGAHIASLLLTYFLRELPELVHGGHLFLAAPPLFRLTAGAETRYARDEAELKRLTETVFKGKKVDVGRFKGLGEMMPAQLKSTTMDPRTRTLLRVEIAEGQSASVGEAVDRLMGSKPEARFRFIQERAAFVTDLDI